MLHAGADSDQVVDSALRLQQWLASSVVWLGWQVFVGVLAALLVVGLVRRRSHRTASAAATSSSDG